VWGVREGMIGFTFDDPNYIKNVPEEIKSEMLRVYEKLKEGSIQPLP